MVVGQSPAYILLGLTVDDWCKLSRRQSHLGIIILVSVFADWL
jgi:hypothetical protein